MRRLIVLGTALALCAGPLAPIAAAADPSLEQVLVESASTPQQHAALGKYYEAKAVEARKQAAYHREMGKTYGGAKISEVARMKDHCEKLAKLFEDAAKEFDMMAKTQLDMAK